MDAKTLSIGDRDEWDLEELLRSLRTVDSIRQPISDRQLFNFLLRHVSNRRFESDPTRLINFDIWCTLPDVSRTKCIGRKMLQFDSLADHLQRLHHRQLAATCFGALVFVFGFELFAHLPTHQSWVLILALGFLISAFVIVFALKTRIVQIAYLSARTVAEILRIRFFMDASGLPFPSEENIPRRYKPAMASVIALCSQIHDTVFDKAPFRLSEDVVKEEWFGGQIQFFNMAAVRMAKGARFWEITSKISLGSGIAAILGLAWLSLQAAFEKSNPEPLLIAGPCLLGIGAICQYYLERRGFKPHSERYLHSNHIYDAGPKENWNETVIDVGTEALHEVVDWYVANVEREISVPLG